MSGFGITRWVALLGVAIAFYGNCANAQITPDGSLPNNSNVRLEGNTFNITGGTQAGSNLFHSFGQFSLPTGGTAFFNNALDIQNIIGRVTGGSISNIDGLIRANGAANLFLINPSGIVFGKNASLNVGGSFLASTASSLKFADGFEFSATAPQSTPLLTINVPIGLQFGQNPGSIQNQSVATNSNGESVGLQVEPGKTLALVGGEVTLDGGWLQAANGRIELAAVAALGTVNFQGNNNNFSLSFPVDIPRADVSLLNAAKVDVTDNGAGSVGITARSIDISGGSKISAGIKKEAGISSVPGNITLNATGVVTIDQLSRIINTSAEGTTGNAGNINIQAGDIFVDNRASVPDGNEIPPALDTSSNGQGRAGNVSLSATKEITLIGDDANGQDKVISTFDSQGLAGGGDISLFAAGSILLSNAYLLAGSEKANGGNISLLGNNISITNNSSLITGTGGGDAGNITIKSPGDVFIKRSLVLTNVGSDLKANAGDINISGRSVSITEGAEITARLFSGGGKAGNISINAVERVEISGNDLFHQMGGDRTGDFQNTVLTTRTEADAIGNAGNITIQAGEILVNNRVPNENKISPTLDASSNGQGRAGNVSLSATGKISLIGQDVDQEKDQVISTYDLKGLGGGDISLSAAGIALSNAYLLAGSEKANGGNISLLGNNISIADNSSLITGTNGGIAGNITIKSAGNVSIQRSLLVSAVGGELAGQAGDINITGQSVFVTDGSELTAKSSNRGGNSGNINIDAKDTVEISGRDPMPNSRGDRAADYIYTTLTTLSDDTAKGAAGNISINTDILRVLDGAAIAADTKSDFEGGDIMVNANVVELFGGGQILTTARLNRGNAGNIFLQVGDGIVLSGTNPNYADDKLRFDDKVQAVNPSSGLFANTQTGTGNGGNIEINTRNLSINNGAGIGINSLGQGSAGSFLNINARDSITLANSFITSGLGTEAIGNGGEINLTAGLLSLTDGAKVEASTSGQGKAGIINAQVKDRISLTNNSQIQSTVESGATGNGTQISIYGRSLSLTNNSEITAQSQGKGNAGNININGNTFDAVSGGKLLTSTSGSGNAGNISVNLSDRFSLSGTDTGLFANTGAGSSGNGGSIEINSKTAVIQDRAGVSVDSKGTGIGGNIEFKADTLKLDNRAFLSAETVSTQGGNIEIQSRNLLLLRRNSRISTNAGTGGAGAGGDGGNITINSPNGFIIAVPNENSDITANASTGSGGKVYIRASGIYGIESRPRQTDLSDITASSELGVQGTINISTPNVDPNRGLLRLSTGLVNIPGLVASNCNAFIGKKGSEFTVTGRGGLPPSPDDFLSSDVVWTDSRLIATTAQQSRTSAAKPAKPKAVEILPATGWVFNDKGEVTLISSVPNTASVSPPTCAKQ